MVVAVRPIDAHIEALSACLMRLQARLNGVEDARANIIPQPRFVGLSDELHVAYQAGWAEGQRLLKEEGA